MLYVVIAYSLKDYTNPRIAVPSYFLLGSIQVNPIFIVCNRFNEIVKSWTCVSVTLGMSSHLIYAGSVTYMCFKLELVFSALLVLELWIYDCNYK